MPSRGSSTDAAARRSASRTPASPGRARRRGPRLRDLPRDLVLVRPGLVAGIDEAGRGPLAGPVVAAAVILDARAPIAGLRDSKLLTAKRRDALDARIRERALCVAVGVADVAEIDTLNILHATMLAMRRAVAGLRLPAVHLLVDGNRATGFHLPATAVVDGDAKIRAIAAASIVAKVHRDRLCAELDAAHPGYGFAVHKGYATAAHRQALQALGPCAAHRRSFMPVRLADALQAGLFDGADPDDADGGEIEAAADALAAQAGPSTAQQR